MNLLRELLLIENPSGLRLYQEVMSIAGYFVAPVFTIALILEYFGDMNFAAVVKKLLLISVFMGSFYEFHTKAVELSLESASVMLTKVSPRNLFSKKWFETKVRTKEKRDWNFIQSLVIPNLNDLLATAFFLMSKVFLWLLKLIYTSVYHLTYVFSGISAILYFLGWTQDSLKGTIQASLWCMLMPFVIVAILALVGNSIDEKALGGELLVAKIDTIIWLFGVTLLLLICPVICYGMIKGDGIHSFGAKMGGMVVSSGMKTLAMVPMMMRMKERTSFLSRSSRQSSGTNQNFKGVNQTHGQNGSSLKESPKSKSEINQKDPAIVEKTHSSQTHGNQTNHKQTEIQKSTKTTPQFSEGKRSVAMDGGQPSGEATSGKNKIINSGNAHREGLTSQPSKGVGPQMRREQIVSASANADFRSKQTLPNQLLKQVNVQSPKSRFGRGHHHVEKMKSRTQKDSLRERRP